MVLARVAWVPEFLAVMVLAGSGAGTSAADDSASDPALAKLGLKLAGAAVMLEAESEVHSKATEVRQLARQWSNAVMQQRSTVSEKEYQSTIKGLTDETNALKNELNATNRMLGQLPMNRGRYINNYAAQEASDLRAYQQQLNWEIAQRNTFLGQLKSQPFDPKAKLKIDAEVRDKSEALHQAVMDLRKLVDETGEKYKELAKNDEAKKVVSGLEKKTGTKLKLSPSRQYHLEVKYLERVEREVSGDSSAAGATTKPSRKAHRTGKAKRSSKPAAGADDSGSSF